MRFEQPRAKRADHDVIEYRIAARFRRVRFLPPPGFRSCVRVVVEEFSHSVAVVRG